MLAVAGAVHVHAAVMADASGNGPQLRQANGIQYVSGGIGSDEAAIMHRLAAQYRVRLRFVDSADGSALSDVSVTLFDARRQIVLQVLSEGPYLYLNPPPGEYRAVVRYGGTIACHRFNIGATGTTRELVVRFPSPVVTNVQSQDSLPATGAKAAEVGPCRMPATGTCPCASPGRRESSN
ncbi:MAG: hypothetical protein JO278_00100 [Dyella sp.]|nr:hypothetical protein [Dyella sp.]